VAFHANPLDGKTVSQLVRDYRVTFLLATPTFLQLYMRSCEPSDFGSLRVVMTGAEKLPERLANAFEEQFGIRPLEGYGCTECSPVVAVNTHDFRSAGFRQVGGKRGRIGHPVPGVSVRIVDPDTREPQPLGTPGLLLVSGPNVMQGYLGKPDKTTEVLVSLPVLSPATNHQPSAGQFWYVTGDIAAIDEDGFLQITDRLSRFSKIGGEMVPHIKVEEKLHELVGATEQTFVVAGVPDEERPAEPLETARRSIHPCRRLPISRHRQTGLATGEEHGDDCGRESHLTFGCVFRSAVVSAVWTSRGMRLRELARDTLRTCCD
jgi:acyl-[acyl-carrier-protein]-phospholipid O-acyltransferase/long-chain-fatty-acid--[acyl-carrier-protein] ligase